MWKKGVWLGEKKKQKWWYEEEEDVEVNYKGTSGIKTIVVAIL